jgi:hypothetical protein
MIKKSRREKHGLHRWERYDLTPNTEVKLYCADDTAFAGK